MQPNHSVSVFFFLMQPDLNKSFFSIPNPILDTIIPQTIQDRYDDDLKSKPLTESVEQTEGVI